MERLMLADGKACLTCAARTLTSEGSVCEPWKLGSANKNGKSRRFVIGRNQNSGTTMRPQLCPHPELKVSATRNTQVMLRELMNK